MSNKNRGLIKLTSAFLATSLALSATSFNPKTFVKAGTGDSEKK